MPTTIRVLCTLLLASGVTACGGGNDSDERSSSRQTSSSVATPPPSIATQPSTPPPTFAYELAPVFSDTEQRPSSARLAEFAALLAATTPGSGSQDLDSCPLGTVADFRVGILEPVHPDPGEFDASIGATGDFPEVYCSARWMNFTLAKYVEPVTIEQAIVDVTSVISDFRLSAPQPLMGGEATLLQYINETTGERATMVLWLFENYLITTRLFVAEFEPQEVCDWFVSILPKAVA